MSKVLKAQTVKVDNENRIHIDVGFIAPPPETDNVITFEKEETPEEAAKQLIAKANKDAEKIREQAAREARNIIEEAKSKASGESQAIREQARDEGYQEGYRKAEAEGESIRAQAAQVLADAERMRIRTEESIEPGMVSLIIDIVKKLLGNTVQLNPGVIVNLIKQGFAGATITGDVFVHVSPYDFEQAVEHKDTLMALTDGSVNLEIIRDLSLDAMDCIIETPYGNVDCSLNQQFEALRNQLTYILQNK